MGPAQAVAGCSSAADERGFAAKGILDRLRAALAADELAQSLQPALKRAEDEAFGWALEKVDIGGDGGSDQEAPVARGSKRVASKADLDAAVRDLRAFADEHEESSFVVEWRTEP